MYNSRGWNNSSILNLLQCHSYRTPEGAAQMHHSTDDVPETLAINTIMILGKLFVHKHRFLKILYFARNYVIGNFSRWNIRRKWMDVTEYKYITLHFMNNNCDDISFMCSSSHLGCFHIFLITLENRISIFSASFCDEKPHQMTKEYF